MGNAKAVRSSSCRRCIDGAWTSAVRALMAAIAVTTMTFAAAPPAQAGRRAVAVGYRGHFHLGHFGAYGHHGGGDFGFHARGGHVGIALGARGYGGYHRSPCDRYRSYGHGHFGSHDYGYAYGSRYYGRNHGYVYGYRYVAPEYERPHVRGFTIPAASSRTVSPVVLAPFSNADQEIKPPVRTHPEVARVYVVPPAGPASSLPAPAAGTPSVSEIREYDPRQASATPYTYPSLPAPSRRDGWTMLAEGDAEAALAAFAAESISEPSDGAPKAGYALAAALGGNLDKGVWAMRRAFRIDPAPLRYVVGDDRLTAPIRLLIDRYEDRLVHPSRRADATFMIAALSYLVHDDVEARTAVEKAVADGDSSASAANLLRLARSAE